MKSIILVHVSQYKNHSQLAHFKNFKFGNALKTILKNPVATHLISHSEQGNQMQGTVILKHLHVKKQIN